MLSAMLKQRGHDADCFITGEEPEFEKTVQDWQPDVVGVYSTTGQETWALEHVLAWRKELPHLKVVMGGPHASFDAEILREGEVKPNANGRLRPLSWGKKKHLLHSQ